MPELAGVWTHRTVNGVPVELASEKGCSMTACKRRGRTARPPRHDAEDGKNVSMRSLRSTHSSKILGARSLPEG